MPELLHMDSGRYGWILLAVLYVVFDILLPLLKKRRQKQRPVPKPDYSPPPPPTPGPHPPVRPQPVRQARRTAARAPAAPVSGPPAIATLTMDSYEPFLALPGVAVAAARQRTAERLFEGARRPDFPASLDTIHTDVFGRFLHDVPPFRADVVAASGLGAGVAEIRSIQELVEASDRLAVGWVDAVFADAVGLALFGPAYARLRMLRLKAAGQTHHLALQANVQQALALQPPLRVIGRPLLDGLAKLDMRAQATELAALLSRLGGDRGPIKLAIGGLGRNLKFELDARPAVAVTRTMMTNLLDADFEAFKGDALTDLARGIDTAAHSVTAAKGVRTFLENGHLPASGRARLMSLLLLADRLRPEALRRLAGASAHMTKQGPSAGDEGVALDRLSPSALVEAIVLGEILPRRGR